MANFLLRIKAAPEVTAHYLKHCLSPTEYALLAGNNKLNLGRMSTRYALASNYIPDILVGSQEFWDPLEVQYKTE